MENDKISQDSVYIKVNGIKQEVSFDKPIVVVMKKNHPCGDNRFQILRVGMDFKLKCLNCGHEVMVARNKIEKNIKKLI